VAVKPFLLEPMKVSNSFSGRVDQLEIKIGSAQRSYASFSTGYPIKSTVVLVVAEI
jgi:hypothetical protein